MTPTAKKLVARYEKAAQANLALAEAIKQVERDNVPDLVSAEVISLDPKRPEDNAATVATLKDKRAAKQAAKQAGPMSYPQAMTIYKVTGGHDNDGARDFFDEPTREGVRWAEASVALNVLTGGVGAETELAGIELVTNEVGYARYTRHLARKQRKAS
jgi:hypothetical protein